MSPFATKRSQRFELFFGFDTLGHDVQAESVGESDDRFDDRGAFAVGGDVFDEAAIDLEGVDGGSA